MDSTQAKHQINIMFMHFQNAVALNQAIHTLDLNFRHTLTGLEPDVAKMKQIIMDRAVVELKHARKKELDQAIGMLPSISLD